METVLNKNLSSFLEMKSCNHSKYQKMYYCKLMSSVCSFFPLLGNNIGIQLNCSRGSASRGKVWRRKSMLWRLTICFPSFAKAVHKPEQHITSVRISWLPGNPGVSSLFQYNFHRVIMELAGSTQSCRSVTFPHASPCLRPSLLTLVASSKYLTMPFVG